MLPHGAPQMVLDKLPWRDASGLLPFALVSAAVLYAGLVPTLLRRRPDRLRSEIQRLIEPARRLARTRQASHAVDVSAYRAYVISHDTRLLDRSREARARTEVSGAELLTLARQVDLETSQAAVAFDQTIRESHAVTLRRAEVDLQTYRARLPSLQDRFQATQDAAEHLDALLARKMDERVREAQRLILYQDLGNVALSLLGGAAVLAVTRLVRREQRARAGAEAAVRSRDQVVSIVSHDLRNPLSNVTMAASFLLNMGGPPGQEWATARPHLEMIKRGCDRMNRMIQDLLDVARIESGRLTIERAPVAVESLMDHGGGRDDYRYRGRGPPRCAFLRIGHGQWHPARTCSLPLRPLLAGLAHRPPGHWPGPCHCEGAGRGPRWPHGR